MRRISLVGLIALLVLVLSVSATAFDGLRKGIVLGGGYGYIPVGPQYVRFNTTMYTQGMSFRFMIGYGLGSRSMLTFSRTTMGTIKNYQYQGKDQLRWDVVNVGWELAFTRYRLETASSTFWRGGLGLVDWGSWGGGPFAGDRQWNLALVAGAGYEIWRGCQLQLDLMTGPGPSNADRSLKALVRLELVGIIY
jgi:hypothetical protein